MDITDKIQHIATTTSAQLCDERKADFGQFYTAVNTADFMSSLFSTSPSHINLLDAGAGSGMLTASYINSALAKTKKPKSISCYCFEIDTTVHDSLRETLELCAEVCRKHGVKFEYFVKTDFVAEVCEQLTDDLFTSDKKLPAFNRIIINPPYKKIRSDSNTHKILRRVGVHSNNLYSVFVSLCLRLLMDKGELVAITPRSFCNGPYFTKFRKDMFERTALEHIHVFESRTEAFKEDKVLQENVIFKLKAAPQKDNVVVSSTRGRDFSKVFKRKAPLRHVLSQNDATKIIHIIVSDEQVRVAETFERFEQSLSDIGLAISTGPVVDFRHKTELVDKLEPGDSAPLFYAGHFDGLYIDYNKELRSKKKTAITICERSEKWLVKNLRYVITKRFSSKEERRRLVATIYEPNNDLGELLGFENHLNYFHALEGEISEALAKGLFAYLNSTIVDDFFRLFSGHTQVNSTDLRYLRYPSKKSLESLGKKLTSREPTQDEIDSLVEATC